MTNELTEHIDAINTALDVCSKTVGEHLAVIREEKLYKETHSSFDAFVTEVFGRSRDWADKHIRAYSIKKSIPRSGLSESLNERQLRELAKADSNQREQVLSAVETTGPVTAKRIREEVNKQTSNNKAPDSEFDSLISDLKAIDRRFRDLEKSPAGAFLTAPNFKAAISQAIGILNKGAPRYECPRCKGKKMRAMWPHWIRTRTHEGKLI